MASTSRTKKSATLEDKSPLDSEKKEHTDFFQRNFILFLGLIFPLAYYNGVVGTGDTLRYVALAAFILLILVNALFNKNENSRIRTFQLFTSRISVSVALLLLLRLISIHKSLNIEDAIYSFTTDLLFYLLLFIIANKIILGKFSISSLIKSINIAVTIFILFSLYDCLLQFSEILETHSITIRLVTSLLVNKNFLSETLLLALPFLFYGALTESGKMRHLSIINFILSVGLILILQSLSVFITMFLSTIIFIYLYRFELRKKYKFKKSFFKLTILASILILILLSTLYFRTENAKLIKLKADVILNYVKHPDIIGETSKQNNNSIYDRILMAKNSIAMSGDHFWTGVGLNNWKIVVSEYGIGGTGFLNYGIIHFEHPHNEYLLILSECGIFALLAYLSFFSFLFYYGIKLLKKNTEPQKKLLISLMLAGISSFMIDSLFAYPANLFFPKLFMIIMAGVIFGNYFIEQKEEVNKQDLRIKIFHSTAILVALFVGLMSMIRFNSERHLFRVLLAQSNSEWSWMSKEAELANTSFFRIDNSGTPVYWYEGLALFYAGDTKKAMEKFISAEEINPYHIQLLNDIGSGYEMQGDHTTALIYYKRALAINKYFPDALVNASAAYYNSGKPDSSYQFLRMHPQYDRSGRFRNNLNFILAVITKNFSQSLQDSTKKNYLDSTMTSSEWLYQIHVQSMNTGRSYETELDLALSDSLINQAKK